MRPPFTDTDILDGAEDAAPAVAPTLLLTSAVASCACPACTARAVALLLDSGRVGMARTVLEPLPEAIQAALKASYEDGLAEGRRLAGAPPQRLPVRRKPGVSPRRTLPPALPRKPRPSEMLDAALTAGRTTPERVAELPGVHPRDVPALREGRVGLPATTWARLLDGIADDIRRAEGLP